MLKVFDNGLVYGHLNDGAAPLCVLLHGWQRDSSDMAALAAILEGHGLATLRIDLPGFGSSPAPESPWSSGEYAEAVGRVIDEVQEQRGAAPVLVVGHSFGGRIALHLAAWGSPVIAGVIISGVPLFRPKTHTKPPVRFRLARWANRRGLISEERMEGFRNRFGSTDYRNAQGVLREIFVKVVNEDYSDLLTRVRVPLKLVWGSADTSAPLEQARIAQEMVPGSELVVLEGEDHFGPITSPATIAEAVLAVAARLGAREDEGKG